MCTGIATRRSVPTQDPLLDFDSEVKIVYTDPITAPTSWPVVQPPTHAIDTTSRVVSFVLGFALASLIAWLGSISGDEVAATGNSAPVASVGTPVVAAAIHEKTPATTREPQPTGTQAVAASSTASAPASAPRPIAAAIPPPVARPAPAAPAKTAESAPAPSNDSTTNVAVRGKRLSRRAVVELEPCGCAGRAERKGRWRDACGAERFPIGSRAIVVRRDGYSPWSASVRVVANQRTIVRANLIPQSGS
jgi:hypothetical protein